MQLEVSAVHKKRRVTNLSRWFTFGLWGLNMACLENPGRLGNSDLNLLICSSDDIDDVLNSLLPWCGLAVTGLLLKFVTWDMWKFQLFVEIKTHSLNQSRWCLLLIVDLSLWIFSQNVTRDLICESDTCIQSHSCIDLKKLIRGHCMWSLNSITSSNRRKRQITLINTTTKTLITTPNNNKLQSHWQRTDATQHNTEDWIKTASKKWVQAAASNIAKNMLMMYMNTGEKPEWQHFKMNFLQ